MRCSSRAASRRSAPSRYGLADEGLAPVDLVVGPGSAWVTAAKVELVGDVAIDLPAGPSEGLVLADATADPATVAADLITQAEHGVDSPALLVTPDEGLADAVEAEVRRRLSTAARRGDPCARARRPRPDRARPGPRRGDRLRRRLRPGAPLDRRRRCGGGRRADPQRGLDLRRPLVPRSPPATMRRARITCSPRAASRAPAARWPWRLRQVHQVQRITREGLAALRPTIRTLAEAEGLLAHRDAVEARFDDAATDESAR